MILGQLGGWGQWASVQPKLCIELYSQPSVSTVPHPWGQTNSDYVVLKQVFIGNQYLHISRPAQSKPMLSKGQSNMVTFALSFCLKIEIQLLNTWDFSPHTSMKVHEAHIFVYLPYPSHVGSLCPAHIKIPDSQEESQCSESTILFTQTVAMHPFWSWAWLSGNPSTQMPAKASLANRPL